MKVKSQILQLKRLCLQGKKVMNKSDFDRHMVCAMN